DTTRRSNTPAPELPARGGNTRCRPAWGPTSPAVAKATGFRTYCRHYPINETESFTPPCSSRSTCTSILGPARSGEARTASWLRAYGLPAPAPRSRADCPGGPRRSGVLLVRVGQDQHPVDVHDHFATRVRLRLSGQLPEPSADFGPCLADGRERAGTGRGEGVDQSGDGRVGRDRPEHSGLGPQHRHVRQAVAAERDGQGEVEQDLAGIVHRPRLAPRGQGRRQRGVQAGPASRLHQEHPAGLRDRPLTAAPDADTRIQPTTLAHLRSAALLRMIRTLDKSHRPRSVALLVLLIKLRTATLVKARD
ncbi:hypothetical protein GGE06_002080, partial [Streptomyces sp. SFB5A]|nr:hypothetical protein [Streptomyces nymphaeiformis]